MTGRSSAKARQLVSGYLATVTAVMQRIEAEETPQIEAAAALLARQVHADRLVHIYGPGGHSNLASQEVFFRAGGLMHMSAILDEGTLLSNGALRSMAIERTPGIGRIVIRDQGLGPEDVLILVNAYGINAALIDAALEARERGVRVIGISSRAHAEGTSGDHPARHPTKQNLLDIVDLAVDTKVPVGDAVVRVPGMAQDIAAISTFANAFALNALVIHTVALLVGQGVEPPVWRSGNAPGGDAANARFIERFRGRVRWL
ncbi:MAG: sugar isomerase domain-containing protein [Paracoccus sp. (in: a-proteobacteria)]|nr:sugar isomerase domain-containing protein [Paracoccus sp. (in: a-proteobacteria)]